MTDPLHTEQSEHTIGVGERAKRHGAHLISGIVTPSLLSPADFNFVALREREKNGR